METATAPVEEVPRCPQCQLPMAGGAVLCVNCGYDSRTGKRLSTEAPQKTSSGRLLRFGRKKKAEDRMAPDGSFIMGLVLSAVFALTASLLWIGFAWLTGFSIGWIAILIGGAAGVGMQAGHRGYSVAGGFGAAAMTFVAILAAKFAVLLLVLMPRLNHAQNWSFADFNLAAVALYFFSPIGCIIILIGMGFAFKTASGSSSN
jgi:phosphate/sulfate permease